MNQHQEKHNRIRRIKDLIAKYKLLKDYYKVDRLKYLLKKSKTL